MSDPANVAAPGARVRALVSITVKITRPLTDADVVSPLVMEGWHEPRDVEVLQVSYEKSGGGGGEGPVTPSTTPDPTNPNRMLWNHTFANALTTGQDYIASAHIER